MSLKQIFFKDSFVYGFSSYLSLIAAFILTPIYTRILSKEDYGVMDLCNTWNNFFILIIPLGLSTAILRLYHEFSSDLNYKKQQLGTLLVTLIFTNVIYVFLCFIFFENIINTYYNTELNKKIYYLSIGIVSFTVLTSYFQALNRIKFKKYTFLLINIVSFLILTLLGFFLVVIFECGILGFFIASFTSSAFGLLLSIITGLKEIYFNFNFKLFKSSLSYSLPLLLVLIFIKFTYLVDRIIINNTLDLSSIGEYSIVMRISNVFQLFVGAFTTAWFPFAMSIISNNDRDVIYRKSYKYYLLIFSLLGLCLMLFTKEMILFFAPNYMSVEPIIYIVIPSVVIGGATYFLGLGIHIVKKTTFFIYSSFISFVINIIASIFFVNFFGLIGIAIGSLIAITSWVLIEYYFSLKLAKIHFNFYAIIIILITMLLCGYLTHRLNSYTSSLAIGILIKLGLIAIISSLLFLNKNFKKDFFNSFGKYLKK